LQRLDKILVNSSQQCGRSSLMELDICNSIVEFMDNYPQSYVLDFCPKSIDDVPAEEISTLIIGCEGGFSKKERELIDNEKVVGFSSNLILRSETALLGAESKILI
jgi:16S rRNA (uracil1498-N3)-methyltransferase